MSSGINYNSAQLEQTSSITSDDTDGWTVLQTHSFAYVQLTVMYLYNMHQQVSHLAVAYNNNYQSQNYFYQTIDWGTMA